MLPDYFFISDVTWRESLAHDFLRLEIRVLCQLVLWYRLKLSMLYGRDIRFPPQTQQLIVPLVTTSTFS